MSCWHIHRELTEEGPSTIWPCLSLPSMVTTLVVMNVEKIEKPQGSTDESMKHNLFKDYIK